MSDYGKGKTTPSIWGSYREDPKRASLWKLSAQRVLVYDNAQRGLVQRPDRPNLKLLE
jgi:hypothetical protein